MADPIPPRQPDEPLEAYIARVRPTQTTLNSPTSQPAFDPDLVPEEVTDNRFKQEREEIDAVLGRMNIVDAYNKYCGKSKADARGRTENIMVRCPIPGHEDEHPSVALETTKGDGGVGICYLCGVGFDKYDLAAWHYGYDVPGYKVGAEFPKLRRQMAEGLGYTIMVAGKDEWLEKIQPSNPVASPQSEEQPVAPTTLHRVNTDESIVILPYAPHTHIIDNEIEGLDWRTLPCLAQDSFLKTWMMETSRAHQPEEFYLFHGFAALGLAVGNKVYLDDETRVRPNTLICLVGGTGTGKSRSVSAFSTLLYEALPFHEDSGGGVRFIHSPGSGEDLVNQMIHFTTDPVTKEKTFYAVRGFMYEDEMEAHMGKINKPNSTLRSNLMKFFDSDRPVSKSSQTYGASIARDHFLQVLTTTQPSRLGTLMTTGDASSGFLNRWMFVYGTEKFRPSISTVRLDLRDSARLLQEIRAWSSPGQEVQLDYDPVTTTLWDEFVQTQVRPLEATDELLVSRIELQCKKLLLLMAINDKSTTILESHMQSLTLMFQYLKRCYGVVEEKVGHTDQQDCNDAIRNYFALHPNDDITMRILEKQSGARRYDDYTRAKSIEILQKIGIIVEVPTPKSARVIRWHYAPDVEPLPPALAPVIQLRP